MGSFFGSIFICAANNDMTLHSFLQDFWLVGRVGREGERFA